MQAGTDRELVEASRRGDRAAFAQIIERYHRAVYAVAFSGVRDRALADDLAQDTFVAAWRRLHELRESRKLPAWLCGITRNLARDARKRARRETLGEIGDVVDTTTPYEAMSEAQCERLVATALGHVPDVYREPLVLYYYEERSVEDVARSLGISAATTNKRLSRGRRYLAERVATLVSRGVTRRRATSTLAASVLAIIGTTVPASHVDASPVQKGSSTMHKLALAAAVVSTVTGGGLLVHDAIRGREAHASSPPPRATAATTGATPSNPAPAAASGRGTTASAPAPARARVVPSLPSALVGLHAGASTDCAAVGRHMMELENDLHAPDELAPEASSEQCERHYATICDAESWPLKRRLCVLAAGDLLNAHLCASDEPTAQTTADIPPALACDTLAAHMAPIVQGAGLYVGVSEFTTQIESACEVGAWSIGLRQCFAAAHALDGLASCVESP
ncbi:MAG: RNA polymerase sigma factor [Acidobacteriota bacterium]